MRYDDFTSLQTPAYLFSLDELSDRLKMIRAALGEDIRLIYAMKANPFLTEYILPQVDGLEVCSPGEEHICESIAAPGESLVLSGVNKEKDDFRRILAHYKDAPVYTVESASQMRMLQEVASEAGLRLHVLLRLSAGNQFGMDGETILSIIREKETYDALEIGGLQLFSGTQKQSKDIRWELEMAAEFLERVRRETAFEFETFEYGPGLACAYFQNEPEIDDAAVLAELKELLSALPFEGKIALEMGRFITAYCGYYATRVADVKRIEDKTWCIMDGGIHQVNYYGQMMAMKLPHVLLKEEGEKIPCAICGSLCTTADVLVREMELPEPKEKDLLVFCRVGAYSVTEGIGLFLSRDLPRVYVSQGGQTEMIRDNMPTWRMNHGKDSADS